MNRRQGQFGEQAICAIATAAGLDCARYNLDPGIDWELRSRSGERASLQVKTTRDPLRVINGDVRFKLESNDYDLLREDLIVPLFLVVMRLRPSMSDWVRSRPWGYAIQHQAWYVSLVGEPPAGNRRSVTVSLPRANLVTPDSLRAIVEGGAT